MPSLRAPAILLLCGMLFHAEPGRAQDDPAARALGLLREIEVVQVRAATDAGFSNVIPDDAGAHLTYASIVFYRAQTLFRFGKPEESKTLFRDVELELTKAIELSAQDTDAVRRNLVRSQSANLLGDIYNHIFADPTTAKAFYEEALRYFSAHPAAAVSLKVLQ